METQQITPYPLSKSLTDKSVALFCIIILLPVFAGIVCVMTVSMIFSPRDRGRWLYRERRLSCGKEFDILKFRILRENILNKMPSDNQHAGAHEHNVANLTWAGRYLLKPWYLDELPQLFNILMGNMSLVGPRPWPLPLVREQIRSGLTYRNTIRAGWTGLAQLQKGKNNSSPQSSKRRKRKGVVTAIGFERSEKRNAKNENKMNLRFFNFL